MKFRANTEITWSLLELVGLLEDEDARVYYEKIKKHLGLHPFHLSNLHAALNEILSSGLNSYDPELRGFLLAYKSPKLLTPLGNTFNDSCFIHVDIEADFYVFRPEVGCTLKGIVNKKGFNHIGVLVHKAFNVSIPKLEHGKQWPGDLVEIGQEIKFKITHLDLTSRLPFIRGSLDLENYLDGCKLPSIKPDNRGRKTKYPKPKSTNNPFYGTNKDSDDSCDETAEVDQSLGEKKILEESQKRVSLEKQPKKRLLDDGDIQDEEHKKHSKKRLKVSTELAHMEEHNESFNNSNDNVNIVNNIDTSIKKRRKSEKSSKKKSLETSQISEPEFDCSDVTIKVEKNSTSNSDNENKTETEARKHGKKSKRQSKKLKYLDATNCSMDNEEVQQDIQLEKKHKNIDTSSIDNEEVQKDVKLEKKHSKKRKLFDSDINASSTPIKLEKQPNNNTGNLSHKDNHDTISYRHKSSGKHIKKSTTDSESEFGNIKVEKNNSESEHTQGEENRKEKILKVIKKEKSMNKSNHDINNTEKESSPSLLPKKHKKKHQQIIEEEHDFESVTIKQEKSDDHSSKYKPQNKWANDIDILDFNITDEYDARSKHKTKTSPKKSKATDLNSEPKELRIKVEKQTIKSELEDKDVKYLRESSTERTPNVSLRKHSRNESEDRDIKVSDNHLGNLTMLEPEEMKHNVSSPRKHSKKSKEPKYEILPGNIKVKIERSSSVESLRT